MKRCEAIWQEAHKARGATTRCKARATKIWVGPVNISRFCAECAEKWQGITSASAPQLLCLAVLDMNDRSTPETIRALRVRYALERKG